MDTGSATDVELAAPVSPVLVADDWAVDTPLSPVRDCGDWSPPALPPSPPFADVALMESPPPTPPTLKWLRLPTLIRPRRLPARSEVAEARNPPRSPLPPVSRPATALAAGPVSP